jgi:hypothetical protein
MLNYPPLSSGVCKYCGAPVTLERHGDGHPGDGWLHYWYTTDHHCPEWDRAVEADKLERKLLEQAVIEHT